MKSSNRKLSRKVIGILKLDTHFQRIKGDVGNASSYHFPVIIKTVNGATISKVISADRSVLTLFIKAAKELERDGVCALTTTCGFLSIFQREIANAVKVPVFTSPLMMVPLVHRMLSENSKIGIITAHAPSLSLEHMLAVGIDPRYVIVKGMETKPEFSKILSDFANYEPQKVKNEVLSVVNELLRSDPSIGAIVLECGNLPPYSDIIRKTYGLPVFDIITLANFVYEGVMAYKYHTIRNSSLITLKS